MVKMKEFLGPEEHGPPLPMAAYAYGSYWYCSIGFVSAKSSAVTFQRINTPTLLVTFLSFIFMRHVRPLLRNIAA